MRLIAISIGAFLSLETFVLACPACLVSNPQKNSFWILSVMGIAPLVLACIVGLYIVRIGKYDQR